jgi:hypothetical protein
MTSYYHRSCFYFSNETERTCVFILFPTFVFYCEEGDGLTCEVTQGLLVAGILSFSDVNNWGEVSFKNSLVHV